MSSLYQVRCSFMASVTLMVMMPALAMADVYECPSYVIATSANVTNIQAPWKLNSQQQKIAVTSVAFSDGPPEEMAFLKPFDVKEQRDKSVTRWKFEGNYQKGKWLSCGYQGDLISLTQKLPETTSTCAVTYSRNSQKHGEAKLASISCR